MDLGLKGKKVLIVGASKNIGAAITRFLVKEGAAAFLVSRDEDKLKALCSEIGGREAGHNYLATDLRMEGKPTEVAQAALRWADGVDVIIHNVGGALGYKDILGARSEWEDVWRFNVGIAIEINRILIPSMRQRKWGRLVHISSMAGQLGEPLRPFGGALPYVAAKAYLNSYVKGLGAALAVDNVVVSGVMPGVVLSQGKFWEKMQQNEPQLVKDFLDHYCPAGRFGKPEEIAPFVVLLASEYASFASGALIPLSGGQV
ncbi:MAG: SDR family NAD(P)-dependent oxidoreductase [Candidatus Omnitrophica bacterium]|nr:SDR family NAD(P)-dependent oxidoreductase [Candidatus Omnitrophota bacterium]